MNPRAQPTQTIDDYLQTIYSLETEGEKAYSGRLARWMRVRPPTAWATVKRMQRDGLVEVDDKKAIHLTAVGRQLAEVIARRHRLSERFLTDVLCLGWAEGHEQAHHFEHGLTPLIEERLAHLLGNPKTCPHGSPIPGTGAVLNPHLVCLDRLSAGDNATIEFISEELEEDAGLMKYLESHGLKPGTKVQVRELLPSNGVIVLATQDGDVPLGLAVAGRIRALPV
jgi:DtxR family transcriptional regulator, iron-dependent repressor